MLCINVVYWIVKNTIILGHLKFTKEFKEITHSPFQLSTQKTKTVNKQINLQGITSATDVRSNINSCEITHKQTNKRTNPATNSLSSVRLLMHYFGTWLSLGVEKFLFMEVLFVVELRVTLLNPSHSDNKIITT